MGTKRQSSGWVRQASGGRSVGGRSLVLSVCHGGRLPESAVEAYDGHGRIHGHTDQANAIEAVAAAAVAGVIEGRDVLIMAPTNAVVDNLNELVSTQLLDVGWLDSNDQIEAGGCVFHPGQPVVTRANDRTLTYGPDASEWVRNGDRWTVNSGTRDELYLTNIDNGNRVALPADYVAAGNVTVDYASTINRAQGATVNEAHMIIDDRTDAKQLYVGTTRGRNTNHLHAAPPAFDLDQHGPTDRADEWTPTGAVALRCNDNPTTSVRSPDADNSDRRPIWRRTTATNAPRTLPPRNSLVAANRPTESLHRCADSKPSGVDHRPASNGEPWWHPRTPSRSSDMRGRPSE